MYEDAILYKMYKEYGVEVPKDIAGLMVSAIVSDTLLFKSPTCTQQDRQQPVANIAEGDVNNLWSRNVKSQIKSCDKCELVT